MISEGSR